LFKLPIKIKILVHHIQRPWTRSLLFLCVPFVIKSKIFDLKIEQAALNNGAFLCETWSKKILEKNIVIA